VLNANPLRQLFSHLAQTAQLELQLSIERLAGQPVTLKRIDDTAAERGQANMA
jgi:hypothetical protein